LEEKDKDNIKISQLPSVKKDTICAVVVTYNRKALLLECLEALRKQTRPLDAIYIIDNASTDGTPEILLENNYIPKLPPSDLIEPWEISFLISNLQKSEINSQLSITVHYVRMHENTGGAGGFYEGVKRAYEKGYDWLWLMDDDVEAKKDALERMITNPLFGNKKFGFYCSHVIWKDGKPAIMNIPNTNTFIRCCEKSIPYNLYLDYDIILVQSCSYVSLLFSKQIIENIGYGLKDIFIWGDDAEYTHRISQKYYGIYIINSVVVHKISKNIGSNPLEDDANNSWKYYYYSRNNLYIAKRGGIKKYLLMVVGMLRISIKCMLFRKDSNYVFFINILRGIFSSLFFNPEIEFPKGNNNE